MLVGGKLRGLANPPIAGHSRDSVPRPAHRAAYARFKNAPMHADDDRPDDPQDPWSIPDPPSPDPPSDDPAPLPPGGFPSADDLPKLAPLEDTNSPYAPPETLNEDALDIIDPRWRSGLVPWGAGWRLMVPLAAGTGLVISLALAVVPLRGFSLLVMPIFGLFALAVVVRWLHQGVKVDWPIYTAMSIAFGFATYVLFVPVCTVVGIPLILLSSFLQNLLPGSRSPGYYTGTIAMAAVFMVLALAFVWMLRAYLRGRFSRQALQRIRDGKSGKGGLG